jgi:N-acetylglucosamine-6-phosphate deacetylase
VSATAPRRLLHGRAFVGGEVAAATLALAGDRIVEVRRGEEAPPGAQRVDGILVPGFVDLHVHGGAGADFMDGDEAATRRVCAFHARHGTVALAATTLSAPRPAIAAAVRTAAAVAQAPRLGEARLAAMHLEGPYLAAARAGAQDPGSLRAADRAELDGWLALAPGMPFTMTVAPEVQGVLELIASHASRVRFSLGHSEASSQRVAAALAAGARGFTHLFNAMPPLHHREPGVVGAALADASGTIVELIADGLHVHPLLLGACARLLGERVALVSDAMRACGMPAGSYRLGPLEVTVAAGAARLEGGALAGSLLTMAAAVRTMVQVAGVPLAAVLPLASTVPARALGLAGKGRLVAGADADLVELDDALRVARAWIGGEELAGETA